MGDNNTVNNLPPGFRFTPTDEELVVHFLHRRAALLPCHPDVIPDLNLHSFDPWHLEGKAMAEGKKWYFYSRRGSSRTTENGFWKAVGVDEPIFSSSGAAADKVGVKKCYAFYVGEQREGAVKTDWIMHEYRLSNHSASTTSTRIRRKSDDHSNVIDYSKWVICRVYEQNNENEDDNGIELSCMDEVFMSLDDDLDEISLPY
ncbi:unnamed protein product [Cuscuta epithymum]|uniref:NAC domain-containing protein n=1 Tax=Cuscuta epithymum TaxID=186058 RepID=A0AAV0F552_9ASTE|nr:unnamed protein product [Cuscuta epithymum]